LTGKKKKNIPFLLGLNLKDKKKRGERKKKIRRRVHAGYPLKKKDQGGKYSARQESIARKI